MKENLDLKSFILKIISPYRWYLYGMLFVGVYSSVHSVVQPYALKRLIDTAIEVTGESTFLDKCLVPGGILIAMGLAIMFVWRFYNYLLLKSLPRLKADVVTITTEKLRQKPYVFFQNNLSGALGAKIADLTANLQDLINSYFNISRQALTIIIAIGMSAVVHVYFSLVFLVASLAFIYMAYFCASSIQPYAKKFAESRSRRSGIMVDSFVNASNVLLFAREKYEEGYLKVATDDVVKTDQSMQWKNMINATILGCISWGLGTISIVLLLYLGSQGLVTVGDFAFIFILSIMVTDQIWFLTENLLSMGEKVGIAKQALQTIIEPEKTKIVTSQQELMITKGNIQFKDVHFRYKESKPLFEGLNIAIEGGKKIGLVGSSGGGKSTFVNLMTRLYEIDDGSIIIDEKSIHEVSLSSLRESIAFIPQDPQLFHRSLLENIGYGNVQATKEEIIIAAKKAHADEFINTLPEGYDTLVGERGVKLSGGQRQRISIARAILKNAPILVLDEATSSLDSVTEKYIQDSLNQAMTNKTVFVIAHRLSTILAMDEILVFDKGNIVERGNHDDLVKKDGVYKHLWDVQKRHDLI